jgi:F0F1-type ATP synthase assembly protein I
VRALAPRRQQWGWPRVTGPPDDTEQTGRRRRATRQGLAYQGAFEAVVAILVAGGIGAWADSSFGDGHRYLMIGTALGFGSFVLRLMRLGKQLEALSSEDPEDETR